MINSEHYSSHTETRVLNFSRNIGGAFRMNLPAISKFAHKTNKANKQTKQTNKSKKMFSFAQFFNEITATRRQRANLARQKRYETDAFWWDALQKQNKMNKMSKKNIT